MSSLDRSNENRNNALRIFSGSNRHPHSHTHTHQSILSSQGRVHVKCFSFLLRLLSFLLVFVAVPSAVGYCYCTIYRRCVGFLFSCACYCVLRAAAACSYWVAPLRRFIYFYSSRSLSLSESSVTHRCEEFNQFHAIAMAMHFPCTNISCSVCLLGSRKRWTCAMHKRYIIWTLFLKIGITAGRETRAFRMQQRHNTIQRWKGNWTCMCFLSFFLFLDFLPTYLRISSAGEKGFWFHRSSARMHSTFLFDLLFILVCLKLLFFLFNILPFIYLLSGTSLGTRQIGFKVENKIKYLHVFDTLRERSTTCILDGGDEWRRNECVWQAGGRAVRRCWTDSVSFVWCVHFNAIHSTHRQYVRLSQSLTMQTSRCKPYYVDFNGADQNSEIKSIWTRAMCQWMGHSLFSRFFFCRLSSDEIWREAGG